MAGVLLGVNVSSMAQTGEDRQGDRLLVAKELIVAEDGLQPSWGSTDCYGSCTKCADKNLSSSWGALNIITHTVSTSVGHGACDSIRLSRYSTHLFLLYGIQLLLNALWGNVG
jgi:hypothetical protein